MDLILIIIGAVCMIVGFVGSFLPVLPGTPLSYAGLLCLQFTSAHPFSLSFLIFWALVVIGLMILDNLIPVWGTKRYGGTSYGIWGSIIGLAAGLFFPPFGIVLGPLAGAFLGELIAGQTTDTALKSAWGSFVGLLLGTLINVIAAGVMGYYFVVNM
jgi:uncharacterized protein YqgC (DUF456 family)